MALRESPESFLRKLDQSGECWTWKGPRDPDGYGRTGRWNNETKRVTTLRAHRVAWEFFRGPIPAGALICHRCDNPPCCRPDHLFLGTHATNAADMVAKGRHARTATVLTDDDVATIRQIYSDGSPPLREVADMFGVSRACVCLIRSGKRRADVQAGGVNAAPPHGEGGEGADKATVDPPAPPAFSQEPF